MEEISDHAKNLTLSEDLEKPLEQRVNMFYNFVKVNNATLGFQKHFTVFLGKNYCFYKIFYWLNFSMVVYFGYVN